MVMRIANHLAWRREAYIDPDLASQAEWDTWFGALAEGLRSDLVHVDISNVADYLESIPYKEVTQKEEDGDGYIPPWPMCWMEFRTPASDAGNITDIGVVILTHDLSDGRSERWWQERRGGLEIPDARFGIVFDMFVWVAGDTAPQGPVGAMYVAVDQDGRILDRVEAEGRTTRLGAQIETAFGFDGGTLWHILDVCLFAVQFANCRNVERIEVLPMRQQRRAAERKGEPINSHYVLAIDANTQRKAYPKGDRVSMNKRLHVCRGHFATYTEDAPLFGKLTGRFWVPAHVRGTTDHGVVGKDYAVLAPTGD